MPPEEITTKSEKSLEKFEKEVFGEPLTEAEKLIYTLAFTHGWNARQNSTNYITAVKADQYN